MSTVVLVAIVVGSAFTVAYSLRFLWGAFLAKPSVATTHVHAPSAFLVSPLVLLAVAGLFGGVLIALIEPVFAHSVGHFAPTEDSEHLALWHGFTLPLLLSVVAIASGAMLFVGNRAVAAVQRATTVGLNADAMYRRVTYVIDRFALTVTAASQRGSLPFYVAIIILVLITFPTVIVVRDRVWPENWMLWDSPLQLVIAIPMVAAAIAAARSKQRLGAVLLVSVTGYGAAALFAMHGAPDVALTQFLVETLTLVVFVLVLRKLPTQILDRLKTRQKVARILIAIPAGALIACLGAIALDSRLGEPISDAFPAEAYSYGGGKNVVNVTLVDIRAWDTMGEISVLVAAAIGVASLVFVRRKPTRFVRTNAADTRAGDDENGQLLVGTAQMSDEKRSVILEVATRLVFHVVIVLSIYLLFAGHNVPGGGFAGGLVAGLALVIRYLAAGRYELDEAAPVDAGKLLGVGLLLSGATAVAGFFWGDDVLQSVIAQTTLPLFGDVKLVTSLFFDIGVYLIVVGLVLDILRSLGAELDERAESA